MPKFPSIRRAAATAKYVRRDVAAGADMVLHVGDIAYANGRSDVWDSFMDAIEPAASRVPYMVAVGARIMSSAAFNPCFRRLGQLHGCDRARRQPRALHGGCR
jgi:hypothetical protein